MKLVGVVLAGGRSTRFGSEKAVAEVDGAPMIARVAAVLARGCAQVAVNAPANSGAAAWAQSHRLPVFPDPPDVPDGPLAGVLAGLEWADAEGAELMLTAPCDTPDLPRDYVRRLLADRGGAPAGFATTEDGDHPLCAFWSADLRASLATDLANGHPSSREWLKTHGGVPVRFSDADAFANWNRRP